MALSALCHVYAEKPLSEYGGERKIIVFHKYTRVNKVYCMGTDTLSRATRAER
jgi:hypothetical protein